MKRIQIETDTMVRLELLGVLKTDQKREGNVHTHPFWELIYIDKGEATVFFPPEERIQLKSGECILISPDREHAVENSFENQPVYWYVGFDCNYLDRPEKGFLLLKQFPEYVELTKILHKLTETACDRKALNSARFDLFLALCGMVTYLSENHAPYISAGEILADKVRLYIREHYRDALTVERIAGSLYITPHHLGLMFKKYTGTTVNQYLLQVRMQEAIRLLQQSNMSLAGISDEIGFDTPQYFSACFHKYFGVAPSVLRNNKSET